MRLNRFIKNSDYTSEKETLEFELTLPSGSITVGAGNQGVRSVDFTVPAGVYFENVIITSSYTGDRKYVGNFLEYEPSDMLSTVTFTVAQINNTTYRLTARVMNWNDRTMSFTFSASAKVHLSIAPF